MDKKPVSETFGTGYDAGKKKAFTDPRGKDGKIERGLSTSAGVAAGTMAGLLSPRKIAGAVKDLASHAVSGVKKVASIPGQAVARHKELTDYQKQAVDPNSKAKVGKPKTLGDKIGQGVYAAQNRKDLAMTQGKGRVDAFKAGYKAEQKSVQKPPVVERRVIGDAITRSKPSSKYGL